MKVLASIRVRLLVVNLLLLAVPAAGVGFARFYEREMLRALEDDMVHQGELVAEMLRADPAGFRLETREALLRSMASKTRLRLRLLDANGVLRADSHKDGPPEGAELPPPEFLVSRASMASLEVGRSTTPPDDLAQRPEVKTALAGRFASTTRLYQHGDRLFLFDALPLRDRLGTLQGVVYLTRSTNPVRAAMYRLRRSLIEVFGIALAITLVLSLFLAATISRPLTQLKDVAGAIARGDRSRRLELDRGDEIGELARAFAAMTERLDARAQGVAELAANISHEFKSPLTSIRGAAELLLDGAADDPEARTRFLTNLLADSKRLDRLVTRLLEFSRLEADPAPDEDCDFEALVQDACAKSGPGVPVAVAYRATRKGVRGKRAHLVSALGNLVDNARQHARPGSRVTVDVMDAASGGLRVTVHNEGEPISAANLARIWDRFFTTRAAEGGSGLGLPIVQQVARAHGGTVSVDSRADAGTTFAFELP